MTRGADVFNGVLCYIALQHLAVPRRSLVAIVTRFSYSL
jgi:hypothetical protein